MSVTEQCPCKGIACKLLCQPYKPVLAVVDRFEMEEEDGDDDSAGEPKPKKQKSRAKAGDAEGEKKPRKPSKAVRFAVSP